MDDLTIFRITKIIELIDDTTNDLKKVSKEEFVKSSLLQRATCFSIEQIGEMMKKLNKVMARQYPNLPWDLAYANRIVIAHHYEDVDFCQIFDTVENDLPPLRKRLKEILNNDA